MKEQIMQALRFGAKRQSDLLGEGFPYRVATWNLRLMMARMFPEQQWRCADLRQALTDLAKEGKVEKCKDQSRIGQAVWKLL